MRTISCFTFLSIIFFCQCGQDVNKTTTDSVGKDSSSVKQDQVKKIYFLNDAAVLNLVFGDSLPEPLDSAKNRITGELVHSERNTNGKTITNSFFVSCSTPFFFKCQSDSLCFIPLLGMGYSEGSPVYKHYYLLLVQEKDHWKFSDSTQNLTVPGPGKFTGIQTFGPYNFMKYEYATECRDISSSKGEYYISVYKNEFCPAIDFKVELFWSDSCSMGKSANEIRRSLKMNYDDATEILQYDETEKYTEYNSKKGYTQNIRFLSYNDTFFVKQNIIRWQATLKTDTVYFMSEPDLELLLKKLKAKNKAN